MSKDIIWYSVNDRLPDEYVSVLVYMPGEAPLPTIHEGYMSENKMWWSNGFDREEQEISHWAEMPAFEERSGGLAMVIEKDNIDVQSIKRNTLNKIASASNERKLNFMKSKKRFAYIAVAATLALGVTVFAASGIVKKQSGSSSSIPDYKSLPSETQVVKDIGYAAVLIDTFENGYKFDNGSIVKNELSDENGNSLEKFKSLDFRYVKDGDKIYFEQKKYNSETEQEGEIVASENGTDIYYFSYTNKLVPPDYELTEEDKKAEENGELVFSYGSSKIEISKVQSVSWEKDGVHYSLMQIDGNLSPDELCDMAKEVINE